MRCQYNNIILTHLSALMKSIAAETLSAQLACSALHAIGAGAAVCARSDADECGDGIASQERKVPYATSGTSPVSKYLRSSVALFAPPMYPFCIRV